jgi:hypothetical protein
VRRSLAYFWFSCRPKPCLCCLNAHKKHSFNLTSKVRWHVSQLL